MSKKKEQQIAKDKSEETQAQSQDQNQGLGLFNMLFASPEKLHFYLVNVLVILLILSSVLMAIADKKQYFIEFLISIQASI
jgi:hypothetical protein